MSREVLAASIIPPTGDCDKLCTSTKVIMKSFETSKSPRRVIAGGVGTVLLRHGNKLKVCMRERAHCVSLAHLAPTNLLCKYARFPRHVADSSVGRIENTKMLSPIHKTMTFFAEGDCLRTERGCGSRPRGHATIVFPCSAPFLLQLRLSPLPQIQYVMHASCLQNPRPQSPLVPPATHSPTTLSLFLSNAAVWCLQ